MRFRAEQQRGLKNSACAVALGNEIVSGDRAQLVGWGDWLRSRRLVACVGAARPRMDWSLPEAGRLVSPKRGEIDLLLLHAEALTTLVPGKQCS